VLVTILRACTACLAAVSTAVSTVQAATGQQHTKQQRPTVRVTDVAQGSPLTFTGEADAVHCAGLGPCMHAQYKRERKRLHQRSHSCVHVLLCVLIQLLQQMPVCAKLLVLLSMVLFLPR
jgi:hypothetical protein